MSDPHLNPIPGTPSNLAAVAKPARKRPTFRRECPECGVEFETHTHDRTFCSTEHKARFHNRSNGLGRVIVPLAMAWRTGRNVKGNTPEALARRASAARAFDEMCRLLDAAEAEDRAEGRMPKLTYVRRRWSADGALSPTETVAGQEALAAFRAKNPDAPRLTGHALRQQVGSLLGRQRRRELAARQAAAKPA